MVRGEKRDNIQDLRSPYGRTQGPSHPRDMNSKLITLDETGF